MIGSSVEKRNNEVLYEMKKRNGEVSSVELGKTDTLRKYTPYQIKRSLDMLRRNGDVKIVGKKYMFIEKQGSTENVMKNSEGYSDPTAGTVIKKLTGGYPTRMKVGEVWANPNTISPYGSIIGHYVIYAQGKRYLGCAVHDKDIPSMETVPFEYKDKTYYISVMDIWNLKDNDNVRLLCNVGNVVSFKVNRILGGNLPIEIFPSTINKAAELEEAKNKIIAQENMIAELSKRLEKQQDSKEATFYVPEKNLELALAKQKAEIYEDICNKLLTGRGKE